LGAAGGAGGLGGIAGLGAIGRAWTGCGWPGCAWIGRAGGKAGMAGFAGAGAVAGAAALEAGLGGVAGFGAATVVVGAGGRTRGAFRTGRAAAGLRGGEEGWARRADWLRGAVLRATGLFRVAFGATPPADLGRLSSGGRFTWGFLATIRLPAARLGAGRGRAGPAIGRRFVPGFGVFFRAGLAAFALGFALSLADDFSDLILLVFAGFLAAVFLRLAGRVFFGGALPAPGFFLLAIDPLLPLSVRHAAATLRRSLAMECPRSNISVVE
jgi:hypothetical protein